MLTNKSYSALACEYSNLVYEKFLEKVYGLNACSNNVLYEHEEEYKLQLEFLKSGYISSLELKKLSLDVRLLAEAKGTGNFYTIQNNTYITNNYTSFSSTGIVYVQASASTVWTIPNTLPFCPNVATVDGTGAEIKGQVTRTPDCSVITITFNSPRSGKAYLS